MATTRRQFLRTGWKIGGSLLGIAAGWTTYEALRPLAGAATGAKLKLARRSQLPGRHRHLRHRWSVLDRQHRNAAVRPVAKVPASGLPDPVL